MSGFRPTQSQLVSGAASATTTAATTLIAAPSEGAICLAGLQLGRTDGGAVLTILLNDLAATTLVLPTIAANGGIQDIVFDAPLLFAPKTAVTFAASAGVSTLYASGQGYLQQ